VGSSSCDLTAIGSICGTLRANRARENSKFEVSCHYNRPTKSSKKPANLVT
jgi:hypothetical protein